MSIERIDVENLRRDGGTQSRGAMNEATVEAYAEKMRAGEAFPPCVAFFDGEDYWLADGFHRAAATIRAEIAEIDVDVRQGSVRDAILFSCGANEEHGLPRTNADKRRAVDRLLRDPEWSRWTDREIARVCKVSHPFVAKMRPEATNQPATGERREDRVTGNVSSDEEKPASPRERTYIDRWGNESTMKTAARVAVDPTPTPTPEPLPPRAEPFPLPPRPAPRPPLTRADVLPPETEATDTDAGQPRSPTRADVTRANREARLAETTALAQAKAAGRPAFDLRLGDVERVIFDRGQGGFSFVHADPPWPYNNAGVNGAAGDHYDGLRVGQIRAHLDQMGLLSLPNAYMVVWCTWPLLRDWMAIGSEFLAQWEYVSGGTWAKTGRIGSGFHWRGDSEMALLYKKRKSKPLPFRNNTSNSYISPRTAHSEKPLDFLETLLNTFAPPGGLVCDPYAGLAPLARACRRTGHPYVGAELSPKRHRQATALYEGREVLDLFEDEFLEAPADSDGLATPAELAALDDLAERLLTADERYAAEEA